MLRECRYEKEFDQVQDVFELQRNLNNAFAYDLVPSPTVITAALRAARRVNDYPTAVRIFEGMFSGTMYTHICAHPLENSRIRHSRFVSFPFLALPPSSLFLSLSLSFSHIFDCQRTFLTDMQASRQRWRTRANTPSTSKS